ncbi:hypothetical protein ACEN2J_18440 [Pseudorhodobacter sp. W20_MBD10_FR17]|uniref:hypothetical protein n=1 Tax=Pseudorhodobacter sp. W20_MBD10_FR17 TaxID=3240266 RepID=UPI003F9AD748
MSNKQSASKKSAWTGISVLAVLSVMAAGAVIAPPLLHSMTASAETHSTEGEEGHSSGGKSGTAGKGGSAGHDSETHDDSESHESGGTKGNDGESGAEGDGKGGNSGAEGDGKDGKGASGNTGAKPVWSKDGLPEVELGRLNVARSPDQVLSRAYAEAMATYTPEMAEFYKLSLTDMVQELSSNWDNVALIDSPLQNLAMLKETLNGTQVLGGINSKDTLMAAFLGTASDKTVPISTDTVIAITAILGEPVTGAAAIKLAEEAEKIRVAILTGHG